MLLDQCPHCGTRFVQASKHWDGERNSKIDEGSWEIVRCQNPACTRTVLVEFSPEGELERIYPAGRFELDQDLELDSRLRDEFREAGIALAAGCYKSSMVMSRRVLQRCLKEQGCTQKKLVKAIDYAIEQDILRTPFHKVADEIREYGNLSAHPDDDQLDNANKDNARKILEFVRLIIHDFYEVPAAVGHLRGQREKSSGNSNTAVNRSGT